MTTEEIAFQALLFRHASTLLMYPEAVGGANLLAESSCELADMFAEGSREHELAGRMAQEAGEAGVLDLQRDYTALFIGSLEMAAPPYASYWLDGAHQLGGPTTTAVERAYRERGMRLKQKRRQPGDHLSTMLEFLFALLRDAAQAAERADAQAAETAANIIAQAHDFFEAYVKPWVGDLSVLVTTGAQMDFYRDLGELLPLVVIEDSLLIENRD